MVHNVTTEKTLTFLLISLPLWVTVFQGTVWHYDDQSKLSFLLFLELYVKTRPMQIFSVKYLLIMLETIL